MAATPIPSSNSTATGDSDLNKVVNFVDFIALSTNFSTSAGWKDGNFNLDSLVNFVDFVQLSNNFGTDLNSVSVPEPSGVIIIVVAMCVLCTPMHN